MLRYVYIVIFILFFACNNNQQKSKSTNSAVEEKPSFFPVTAYIKGQILEINEKGVAPLKYVTINNHTDSSMIKLDTLNNLLNDFLTPVIDTTNLATFFTETKFLDKSIDAFTFTYDPKIQLPDSISLTHWDVYIEPATQKVKRIYLVKKVADNKTLQLTWQSNLWCQIITLSTLPNGTSKVENEVKISWDY